MKLIKSFGIFVLFSVLFTNCESKEKISFEEKGKFRHIDFELIDSKEDDVLMRDYSYLKTKIKSLEGNFSIYIIDKNENNKFNDSTDLVHIDSYLSTKPKNVDFSNKSDYLNSNYYSINGVPFSLKILKKNENYSYDIKWLANSYKSKVSINNRMIDKIPELDFISLNDNEEIPFKKYKKKKKYIYIEFWATWCSPCIQQIPEISELYLNYSKDLEIISIHSEKSVSINKINQIVDEYDMNWTNGISTENINSNFNFSYIPIGYLFDAKGQLIIHDASPKSIKDFLEKE